MPSAEPLRPGPKQTELVAKLWRSSKPSSFLGSGLAGAFYLSQNAGDFHAVLLVGALIGLGTAKGLSGAYQLFGRPIFRLFHTTLQVSKVIVYHRAGFISTQRRNALIRAWVEADISKPERVG